MALKFNGIPHLFGIVPAAGAAAPAPQAREDARLSEVARLDRDGVLEFLESSDEGLLDREAEERLDKFGPNRVATEKRKSPLRQLLERFVTPLNILLLALAVISYLTGDPWGALVISLMVLLSWLLSFSQEYRSNKAAEQLRAMVSTTATVLRKDKRKGVPEEVTRLFQVHLHPRGPEKKEIPLDQLVPGDLVLLSAGDMVPADVRVLTAKDLFINQASLTGEALPVEKFPAADVQEREDAPRILQPVLHGQQRHQRHRHGGGGVDRRPDLLRLGGGQHRRATGADQLRPGVGRFTWLMIRFMAVMVPMVFLINGFTKHDWMEAFLFAVAVAVGLTPEMLPMIVTINLAKGALAMSRKKVIVKRLNAIQNFGAMDVLCTDKTGTLTQDQIILKRHLDIRGKECDQVLEYAYLNSYLPVRPQEPARRRRPEARRTATSRPEGRRPASRRSTKFPSTSSAGGCRWCWSTDRRAIS